MASAASGTETWAPHATAELGRLIDEGATHALVGATTDGKDLAGMVVGRWTWGLLANAGGVTWDGDGPVVEATVLGGKAISRSAFTGGSGVVTVRPNATTAEPAATAGEVERRDAVGAGEQRGRGGQGARPGRRGRRARRRSRRRGSSSSAGVASGARRASRWSTELAALLGGVVGATRASVDAGWIPYARQIGQTGKIVKPSLYLGLGVSGAMQHRVGMQSADAIVIVNRDPDAPIAEIADLFVIGDLFEVGPALVAELRSRRGD